MRNWEYQITRYQIQNDSRVGDGTGFICDDKGRCFLHDASGPATEIIRDAFNEEGKGGWELVQFGYHLGELMCIWKRAMEMDG